MPAWNEENAAHLLRRTGFCARPDDAKKLAKKPFEKALKSLFKKDPTPVEPPWSNGESVDARALQTWWVDRMTHTSAPLIEKLTLFWHGHFACSLSKVVSPQLLFEQNRFLRAHAYDRFDALLNGIARDPAMILMLDGQQNVAASPNENFARELQELFTTGVEDEHGAANYGEDDVHEAARAFTGWTVKDGAFFFDAAQHDFGAKTFKDLAGPLDGSDVLAHLLADPATARRLAWKLFSFFAYETALDDPVIDPVANAYVQGGTSIRAMLEALFRSDAFFSQQAKNARVKSPAEFVVGAFRMLGVQLNDDPNNWRGQLLVRLGQEIFEPESVFGWKEGLAWVDAFGMINRARVALEIATARDPHGIVFFDAKALLGAKQGKKGKKAQKKLATYDATKTVDVLLPKLGLDVAPVTRAHLTAYLEARVTPAGPFALDDETIDEKVRGFVALALSLPEAQLH